jgi:hypothetical protein
LHGHGTSATIAGECLHVPHATVASPPAASRGPKNALGPIAQMTVAMTERGPPDRGEAALKIRAQCRYAKPK